MALDDSTSLPCGRDALDVIDEALAGRIDTHTGSCRYCQAAIANANDQQRIADELRAAATAVPDTLLASVMATVWSELRPGKHIPLNTAGTAFVTELAVSSTIQDALEQFSNLEIRICRAKVGSPEIDTTQDETLLHVEITAAAFYPTDLIAEAELVRARTSDALTLQFGLTASAIDVDIVDLYDPTEAP